MDQSEMMDLYEELVENLHQLHEEASKIKDMYTVFQDEMNKQRDNLQETSDKAKEVILQAEADGRKNLSDLSSTRKKQIDKTLKTLDETVQKASKLESTLDLSIGAVERFSESVSEITDHINRQNDLILRQQKRIDELIQSSSLLDFRLKQLLPNVDIDFDESAPAIDLIRKYDGRIGRPVVLEKKTWTKEYCFKVTGIDEDHKLLLGKYYQMGQPYGQKTTLRFSDNCRMFNRSTLPQVLSQDQNPSED